MVYFSIEIVFLGLALYLTSMIWNDVVYLASRSIFLAGAYIFLWSISKNFAYFIINFVYYKFILFYCKFIIPQYNLRYVHQHCAY